MVLLLGASSATQLRSESCCSRRESSEALSFRSLRSHPCVRRYTLSRVLLRLLLFNAQKEEKCKLCPLPSFPLYSIEAVRS